MYEELIELIRTEAQNQSLTFKKLGEYAGMKGHYINTFLTGGCPPPSAEKLGKIAECLHLDKKMILELAGKTDDILKEENEELQRENEQLRRALKKYQKMNYLYENFDKLEKIKNFIDGYNKI